MALVVLIVFPGFSGFDDCNVFISALNFYKKKKNVFHFCF